MAVFNVQRAITLKVGNPQLWFMCSAHHLIVLNICVKFHENISQTVSNLQSRYKYMLEMAMFNVQRGRTPKVGKQGLCFISSAHCLTMLYICVRFGENILWRGIKIDQICPLAIPKQIPTISMHIPSFLKIRRDLLKLSPGKTNMDMLQAGNSVKTWRNLPISNPKPDPHNINAHIRFHLCWGFTAQSTQWGHLECNQFT